jgi:hypothetical protein
MPIKSCNSNSIATTDLTLYATDRYAYNSPAVIKLRLYEVVVINVGHCERSEAISVVSSGRRLPRPDKSGLAMTTSQNVCNEAR